MLFKIEEILCSSAPAHSKAENSPEAPKLFAAPLNGASSQRLPASVPSTPVLLLCRVEETVTSQTNTFYKATNQQ